MSPPTSLAFPSGRTLAGWAKQLAAWKPKRWWVAHLLVHRVEAAVAAEDTQPVTALNQFVLQSLSLEESEGGQGAISDLEGRLHLPGPLLGQVIRQQIQEGWVEAADAGHRLTSRGRTVLTEGRRRVAAYRRETFSFAERRDANGSRVAAPFFIPLEARVAGRAFPQAEAYAFDVGWLSACVAQDRAWKEAHGFPLNIVSILASASQNGDDKLAAWQRVVLDRLEEVTLVLMEPTDRAVLLGFETRAADWHADFSRPVLERPLVAEPALTSEATGEVCRAAWLDWARPRNLPHAEVEACVATLAGAGLRVRASPRLVEMLRQGKSDLLKGEAWTLLAGDYLRQAVRLELAP